MGCTYRTFTGSKLKIIYGLELHGAGWMLLFERGAARLLGDLLTYICRRAERPWLEETILPCSPHPDCTLLLLGQFEDMGPPLGQPGGMVTAVASWRSVASMGRPC